MHIDFLLKRGNHGEELYGPIVFEEDVKFISGIIMSPEATINGMTISDVVLKDSPVINIKGFKDVKDLVGGDEFTFRYINGVCNMIFPMFEL